MPTAGVNSLAFINNKGGVGKTTLACNMAHYLSSSEGLNVLVVDLDPQCNATQLMLTEDQWLDLFGDASEKEDARTVLHPLRHIRRGDSAVATDYDVVRSERFRVDVLAGHPSLALMEDTFSSSWEAFLTGDLGGARRTHWVSQLVAGSDRYDLIVIDAGPSLGALNRSIVVGADALVTPTSADLFSLFALENIAEWIRSWARRYSGAVDRVNEEFEDESGAIDGLQPELDALYLGYTVQQYVTKSIRDGERRQLNSYDQYKRQIPIRAEKLAAATRTVDDGPVDLGIVPHMFSMVPLAQAQHAPIADLTPADGLRGAQISQQSKYKEQLHLIGESLAAALRLGGLV